MRYFFAISYKGTNYNGWQAQKNATGVQDVVEEALKLILQEEIKITGSGRTDTGVHCKQQFFHCDILKKFKPEWLLHRINSFLPQDIAILSIHEVSPESHARFDAISRSYVYLISRIKDPFSIETAMTYQRPLDIPTMNAASSLLIGRHNFESFSKVKTDVSNFVCDITIAEWKERGQYLEFHIAANRFLRGMVRAIAGTLLDIGKGKMDVAEFKNIILLKDRKKAGAAAPAKGLYLSSVVYPEHVFIKN